MNLHNQVSRQPEQLFQQTGQSDDPNYSQDKLNSALRLLAKWRSILIQNTVLKKHGTIVWQGPLKGLDFLSHSAEGCHIAKLLGCYEQPLQPYIEQAIGRPYSAVINIGCAEGYYAVGLARRMLNTHIYAYDVNPIAQENCIKLSEKNGMRGRVSVSAMFKPEDFATFSNHKTLILCDIEGGERDLLDPNLAPALRAMDLIVESHDCQIAGISKLLIERFSASHTIQLISDNGLRTLDQEPAWFTQLAHIDQLLATWEWRSGPTPWLVMQAKQTN